MQRGNTRYQRKLLSITQEISLIKKKRFRNPNQYPVGIENDKSVTVKVITMSAKDSLKSVDMLGGLV